MIIPALFLASFARGQQDFAIPAEASAEFRKLAISIEDAMVEKNYDKGSKLIGLLPKLKATYRVETTKVPVAQRPAFVSAVAASAKMWQNSLDGAVSFDLSRGLASGDINFVGAPIAAPTWQWTPITSPTFLTATLPAVPASVAYDSRLAFAKYLGLATVSKGATLSAKDISGAKKILRLSNLLRQVILSMAPDYRVPAGASSEFHHLVLDIERALDSKDFAAASKLSIRLPHKKVTWSFDDSKLNEDQKKEFLRSTERAIEAWQTNLPGIVEFAKAPKGKADISITFEPILSKIPGGNDVFGAAFFFAADSSLPQLEAVFGLKRGPKFENVLGREIYNESLFTIGRYLGLAPNPQIGTAMGRQEGQMANQNTVTQLDIASATKAMNLSNLLRTAIQKRQVVEFRQPILAMDQSRLDFAPQFQGDDGKATILITNTGTSTLELDVKGDCGCITGQVQQTLLPGKSAILTGKYDTSEITGDVNHNLILKSNDPDRPVLVIPCRIMVNPRAEIVYSGSNTAYLDGNDKSFTFYINSVEAKIFQITQTAVAGMPLTATAEPFEGEVSNFQKLGLKQKVKGYKVVVDTSQVPSGALFGRSSAMVFIRTDHPKIGILKVQMFVQKGIVALPESIYLGSPQGISDSTFVLLRLGRPFSIKKISSDSKFLKFDISSNGEADPSGYTVRVIYDGKAPGHRLKGTVTVETNDPKQPTILIPFQTSQS